MKIRNKNMCRSLATRQMVTTLTRMKCSTMYVSVVIVNQRIAYEKRNLFELMSMTFVSRSVTSTAVQSVLTYSRTHKLSTKRMALKCVSKLESCAVADIISPPFHTFPSRLCQSSFSRNSFCVGDANIFNQHFIYKPPAHSRGEKKTFVKS